MNTMKRITIITSPFACIPPNALGAIERRWYQVANCWRNLGYNVQMISKMPVTGAQPNDDYLFIKGYDRTGSLIKDVFLDLIYSWRSLRRAKKSDVIILNTFWTPLIYPLFKKKFGMSMYNVARFPKGQMRMYNNVDCLSCVSSAVLNAMLKQSPSLKEKSTYVNNPINTDIFCSKEPKRLPQTFKIAYSGRVHKEKGLDILIKAINILRVNYDIQLSIIGPRDIAHGGSGNAYVEKLEKLADGWEINWVDPIYKSEELAEVLSQHDLFCYPSVADKGETFGVAPLEAMGLGLVTIVSALECFQDFVEDGRNGIVFNHRVEKPEQELAKAFCKAISDPQFYRTLSLGALESAKKFSKEHIADRYIELFEKILKKKNG